MEKSRTRYLAVLNLLFWLNFVPTQELDPGCNVTSNCMSWTKNTCAPPPPMLTSSILLRPSPGIANSSYVVCPVVSRWNLTEETSNVTALSKEARLFFDWLCKSPCNNSTNTIRKSCIDLKLGEYGNSSSPRNASLVEGDKEGFRQAVDLEIERLQRIANQPVNFEMIKQRTDMLASSMGIDIGNGQPNTSNTDKAAIILAINNLTSQINTVKNTSVALLEPTASNYEIKMAITLLETRFGTPLHPSMTMISWDYNISRTSLPSMAGTPTMIQQPMASASISSASGLSVIMPSPAYSMSATPIRNSVYPSSCFVPKSHCFTTTNCPEKTIGYALESSRVKSQIMFSGLPSMVSNRALPSSGALPISRALPSSGALPFSRALPSSGAPPFSRALRSSGAPPFSRVMATPTPTESSAVVRCTYDCEGTCNGTKTVDCQNNCGGNATIDDCGECTGGTTGQKPNYLKDCAGVCNGVSLLDACNVCEQPSKSGGNGSRHQDCNQDCFGDAVKDKCGQCVGGKTGLKPSTPDACGVYCNGDNSTCSGCDNVPNSGKVFDACGVCGGSGTTCTKIVKAVPNVVTTAGRNVTVHGAGLSGTGVECTVGSNTATGTIVNITSVVCPVPANSVAATASLRITLTKSSGAVQLGPLTIEYYDSSSLTFTGVSPTEQRRENVADILIHGAGFVQTNMSVCKLTNSSLSEVKAVFINASAYMCQLPKPMKPGRFGVKLSMNGYASLQPEISDLFSFEILAAPPKVLKARFSNSGSQIIVTFTSLRPLITDASMIFAANVSQRLGIAPKCSWIGNAELRITTGQNASILPGDFLILKGNVFKSLEHSGYASGSVPLSGPDTPLLPSPVLKGPSMISSCSGLKLSAAQSTGSGGRPLSYEWKITTGTNKAKIQADLDMSSTASISIASSDIVANEDYIFTVSVKNFLSSNQPKTASHTARKASSPIPELSIVPSSDPNKVLIASDYFLMAKVAVSPCSSNFTAGFTWRSTDGSLSRSSSFTSTLKKQTLLIGKGSLGGGKTYSVTLMAYWIQDPSITSETTITFKTALRPLVAAIKGGDFSVGVDAGKFLLDASSTSYDPDNMDKSLRYVWACIDKETNGNCISITRKQPLSIASQGIVSISTTELKERSYQFTVNVTSSSTNRWKTASATVSIKAGSIPIVIVNGITRAVKPDGKLSIRATVIVRTRVTAVWTTETSTAGSSSIDLTSMNNFITQPTFILDVAANSSAYFVLKPGILQPGAKYTFRLTVKDGVKEGFGQTSFMVYDTPTPGEFLATPATVEALNDVSMSAKLWTTSSDCLPLKYEFGNYEQGTRFTSYGVLSDPSLTVPASLGRGASNTLVLAVRVHSACGTMSEKRFNITSTAPVNISVAAVDSGIDKARKAASSGDLASAVASLDSLLGVTSGGDSSVLKKVESQTLSTVLSLSNSLPKTASVSSSLLGVLKKVDPKKLDTTQDLQSISEAYGKVLDGLKSTEISNDDVSTVLDRLADIDLKSANSNISQSIFSADESLARSLASKTGPGQPPFETTGSKKRVSIKVAYTKLDKPTPTTSAAEAVQINFGKSLVDKFKNWNCSNAGPCEGVVLKMRSYQKSPLLLNDSRLASSGTQVIDIVLSNPISGEDLSVASLTTPVSFNMTVGSAKPGYEMKCVYFNVATKAWENQGMRTIVLSNNVVKCETDHLTAFAVIEDPAVIPTPTSSLTYDTFSVAFILANQTYTAANLTSLSDSVKKWIDGVFSSDVNYQGISTRILGSSPVDKVEAKIELLFKSNTTTSAYVAMKLKAGSGSGGFHIDTSSLTATITQRTTQPANKATPPTSKAAESEKSSAVLLATIFGVLGAILVVVIVVLVVRSLQKRSKVHSQGSAVTASP